MARAFQVPPKASRFLQDVGRRAHCFVAVEVDIRQAVRSVAEDHPDILLRAVEVLRRVVGPDPERLPLEQRGALLLVRNRDNRPALGDVGKRDVEQRRRHRAVSRALRRIAAIASRSVLNVPRRFPPRRSPSRDLALDDDGPGDVAIEINRRLRRGHRSAPHCSGNPSSNSARAGAGLRQPAWPSACARAAAVAAPKRGPDKDRSRLKSRV